VNNLKKLGLILLAGMAFALPTISIIEPANSYTPPIDVGPLKLQNCPGTNPSGFDCIRPTESGKSYGNLYYAIYRSGSGFDVFFCNATSGYSQPTSPNGTYNGCVKKSVGPGWGTNNAKNPYWPSANGNYYQTDIFINVHNNGQTSYFDLWANPNP
jgi:hypothetical protein